MKWNEYEWYGDDSDAKNNFKLWKKNCPQHKRIGQFFEDFFIPKKKRWWSGKKTTTFIAAQAKIK